MNPPKEASTSVKALQRSYKSSAKSSTFEKPMQDTRHSKSKSKSIMKERSKRIVKSKHRGPSPEYSNTFVNKPRSRGRALSDDRESDDREMPKSGRFNRLKNEKSLSSRRKESLDKENSLGLATPNFGKETPGMQSRSVKESQTKSKKKIQRIVFQDKLKKQHKKTPLKNAVSSTGKKKETSKIDEKDKRREKDERREKDDGREEDNGREKKDGRSKKDNGRKKDNRRDKVNGREKVNGRVEENVDDDELDYYDVDDSDYNDHIDDQMGEESSYYIDIIRTFNIQLLYHISLCFLA